MEHSKVLKDYYNNLASNYDNNRFGNTYGQYIHQQEIKILSEHLPALASNNILDLGCGTGRLMPFANYGLDISEEMIKIAQEKFPNKQFSIGNASKNNLQNNFFDAAFCFHVLMHQNEEETKAIFAEAFRVLKKGGHFIFDFPSQKRRDLVNYKASNWHAANNLSIKKVKEICHNKWDFNQSFGILFFPIHRIPHQVRFSIIPLDNLIGQSFLKEYASYLIVKLTKK